MTEETRFRGGEELLIMILVGDAKKVLSSLMTLSKTKASQRRHEAETVHLDHESICSVQVIVHCKLVLTVRIRAQVSTRMSSIGISLNSSNKLTHQITLSKSSLVLSPQSFLREIEQSVRSYLWLEEFAL